MAILKIKEKIEISTESLSEKAIAALRVLQTQYYCEFIITQEEHSAFMSCSNIKGKATFNTLSEMLQFYAKIEFILKDSV